MLEVDRHWVTYACDDGFEMRALLLVPRTALPSPALLFVSEPFGLNDEMQRVASDFAAGGFSVLVPDLLARGGPWLSCVRALMRDLSNGKGRAVADLLAARAFLAARPEVQPNRIGVLGLCMGGGFALLLAKTGLFRVSAPFYGRTPENLDGTCPVVASFGERDAMMRADAEKLHAELERLGVEHNITTYPDAGHSFMNKPPNALLSLIGPLTPAHAAYNPAAASAATKRVIDFLNEHL